MANVIASLTTDALENTSEVNSLDGFVITPSTMGFLNITEQQSAINGRYFALGTSISRSLRYETSNDKLTADANGRKYVEFHSLQIYTDGTGVSQNQSVHLMSINGSATQSQLGMYTTADPVQSGVSRLAARFRDLGISTGTQVVFMEDTPALADGAVLYTVTRMYSQSAAGAEDGGAEIWVNGVLGFAKYDVSWFSDDDFSWPETLESRYFVNGGSGANKGVRDFVVLDGWSSDPETPPPYLQVRDLPVSSLTAADYTGVGDASTDLEALNDVDDTTYLTTNVPESVLSLSFGAGLNNPDVVGFEVRSRVARGGLDDNTIDLGLKNGGAVIDNANRTLVAIGGARDVFNYVFDLNNTVYKLDDLSVEFTNGS